MTSKVFVLARMISFAGLLPLRVAGQEVQGPKSGFRSAQRDQSQDLEDVGRTFG